MHLAIISPYPPVITGIGQYGYHVSRLLANTGEFSKITVLRGGSVPGQIDPFPHTELVTGWWPERIDSGWQIVSQLRAIKPDVAWFNLGVSVFGRSPFANLSGFFSPWFTRFTRVPSVVTLHELPELENLRALKAPGGIFALTGARLLSKLATRADVICLTLKRYVDWLAASQPGPHYMHIPTGAYYPAEMLPEPENAELLFFSTMTPFKGLENLLQAFRLLQAEYPALRLTIAGAAHTRFPEYARHIQAEFGSLKGVNWQGEVPEANLRAMFKRASLVVLPYQASTGSSSILIQAASWGRSMVTSDLDEIKTIARDNGLNITIFPRGEVKALVAAIRAQLAAPAERLSQAKDNFIAIRKRDPDMMCQAYLNAINMALEAQRSSRRVAIRTPSSSGMS